MKEFITIFLFCCIGMFSGMAQKPANNETEFEKQYQQRIKKKFLLGVYIPADLSDSFEQLNKLVDKDSKKSFKNVSEEDAVRKLHFSLGRWMIYNWGFYQGSRLSEHIKKMGIHHPDDMARFIILMYHRYLNKNDLKIKEYLKEYAEQEEAKKKARKERGTVIHQEKRKRTD